MFTGKLKKEVENLRKRQADSEEGVRRKREKQYEASRPKEGQRLSEVLEYIHINYSKDTSEGVDLTSKNSNDRSDSPTQTDSSKASTHDEASNSANDISVIQVKASNPSNDISVIQDKASDPSNDSAVIQYKASNPSNDISVIQDKASSPSNDSTVIQDKASDPSNDSTVIQDKASNPSNDSTVIQDKAFDPSNDSIEGKDIVMSGSRGFDGNLVLQQDQSAVLDNEETPQRDLAETLAQVSREREKRWDFLKYTQEEWRRRFENNLSC